MAYGTGASFPTALPTNQELLQWANGAETTLSVAISAADTSIVLADGSSFPSEAFEISIDSEIIKINSRSGNTCSVGARGYDGTSAATHTPPAIVRANYTRWHHDRVAAELVAVCAALGINFGGIPAYLQRFMVSGDGNYTVPSYFTSSSLLKVELIGGGGGGAGSTTNKGAGGGGCGEYRVVLLTGLTAGATITNTYGGGGNGGGTNTAGSNGGDTSIAGTWTGPTSPITAQGGKGGGQGGNISNGGHAGAYLASPVVQVEGGRGTYGFEAYERGWSGGGAGGREDAAADSQVGGGMNTRDLAVAGAANIYRGGSGGGGPYGSPGRANTAGAGGAASTMNASAGTGYGVGGGGGNYDGSNANTGSGSAGRPGCIIFTVLKV